jgi:hypothetical protein
MQETKNIFAYRAKQYSRVNKSCENTCNAHNEIYPNKYLFTFPNKMTLRVGYVFDHPIFLLKLHINLKKQIKLKDDKLTIRTILRIICGSQSKFLYVHPE